MAVEVTCIKLQSLQPGPPPMCQWTWPSDVICRIGYLKILVQSVRSLWVLVFTADTGVRCQLSSQRKWRFDLVD